MELTNLTIMNALCDYRGICAKASMLIYQISIIITAYIIFSIALKVCIKEEICSHGKPPLFNSSCHTNSVPL